MLTNDHFADNDSLESVKQYAIYFADESALSKLADNYAQSIVDHNSLDFPSVGGKRTSDNGMLPPILEDESDVEEDIRSMLQEVEEIGRQFSPAEFWIHALNQRNDADEAWHIVDSSIGYVFSRAARVHAGRLAYEGETL